MAATGRLEAAIAAYRRLIDVLPPAAALRNNLANVYLRLGRVDEALASFRSALEIEPGHAPIRSNYLLAQLYRTESEASEVLEAHLEWERRHAKPPFEEHPNRRQPERRLRVGYLSNAFRFHPKYFLILPLLRAHDRRRFTVYCYSNSRIDGFTTAFRRAADAWRDIRALSDEDCAALIRRDRIDILVDLDGHFGGNRLGLFSMRPAPVQISLPGYPHSTGLGAIPYRLSDALVDVDGEAGEELVRVPGSFACFRAARGCPPVAPPPALRNGYVTFACFNARQKYSDRTLAWWAEILRAVPHSRLLLHHAFNGQAEVTEEFRRPIVRALRSEGISAGRIEMTGGLPFDEHMAAYGRADIMLDTYPYNGMTTTFESLWMGVPVVTLAGQEHRSRVGLSILTRAGLADCVCATPEEYVQTAVRLASDVEALAERRRTQRTRVRRTPPFDVEGHAREVEQAYRALWRRWTEQ